ncbi:TOMM precursor leader peptide-binding protein [Salipaludibacillus aurantiacus]|uniref:Ribosomal protein S12 methylthiotransferase accessory factor n=1 Tax=Salipaludibacillus aurantiacus TaxID=1601833 RepID=A0A1H9X4Z2_9BACI|nr:TOMM precursor leader peptide-binding protein [Salipaludibacillus aurantiacus]SES41194.1 ribosomal protein S12 methylthiotransferase accessory factor [Salipaludibacillus aurantiacus]
MASLIIMNGSGLLADVVYHHLSENYHVKRQSIGEAVPGETELALVLHDSWYPSVHQKAEERFREAGIPWLRGFMSFGEGIIGPFVRPDTPGCSGCADMRRMIAGPDRKDMWGLQRRLPAEEGMHQDAWTSRVGLSHMAALISHAVQRILQGESSSLEEKISITNMKTLATSQHIFLPNPTCPMCSSLPEDTSELAHIRLESSPKIKESVYRSRSMDELKTGLVKDYLDYRTGLMNGKMQDLRLPFADVLVNMPLFGGDEGVAGRSNSYETSELTAILEGLERYCGIEPRGKRTVVHDSYDHLKEWSLNPLSVGVHETEQYKKPDFPFKPFKPEEPMNWVWGYSLLEERPILVPELLAYYSLSCGDGFVYETSNGCALGGTLEEAIFHAIMEVVERDSFLLTWYARLPLPRLDLRSANDTELQLMVERITEVTGYELYFYNSTMEHGIPSVWAIAKNKRSKGVNIICAAGANPDPVSAVKSSIYELAGMMFRDDEKLEKNRKKYKKMLKDPFAVRTMEDHGMLYGLKEAEERLTFLLDDHRPLRTFAEEFKEPPANTDLKDDLQDILQRLRRVNLDVIVVDQTTPVIERNGLYCAKVLIPGMLPMTFGHHLTRVKGLERVLTVPVQLGYEKKPLQYEQLNSFPHPFP